MSRPARAARERFWEKIARTPTDCWLWFGAHIGGGRRGGFYVSSSPYRWAFAEKYAYEVVFGEPPPAAHRARYAEVCGTEGCINPLHAVYRVGNPRVVVDPLLADTVRFFSWVQIDPTTGCWVWCGSAVLTNIGSINRTPYVWGGETGGGRKMMAYAFAWRYIARRVIPAGYTLIRTCATELCVNPDHRVCVDERHQNIYRDRRHGFQSRVDGVRALLGRS